MDYIDQFHRPFPEFFNICMLFLGFIFERKALRLDKLTDVINELKTNGIIKENQANASKKAAEDMTSTSYGILVKVMYHPPRTLVAIRGDGKVTDADN